MLSQETLRILLAMLFEEFFKLLAVTIWDAAKIFGLIRLDDHGGSISDQNFKLQGVDRAQGDLGPRYFRQFFFRYSRAICIELGKAFNLDLGVQECFSDFPHQAGLPKLAVVHEVHRQVVELVLRVKAFDAGWIGFQVQNLRVHKSIQPFIEVQPVYFVAEYMF